MARRVEFLSSSIEETKRYGFEMGKILTPNSVLVFLGDLGAGKTTFIKGIVQALGKVEEDEVNSPTFVYLNCYNTQVPVYHFDLYRLKSSADFIAMGFLDYLQNDGITLIEWGERIADIIPDNAWIIEILHEKENSRKIAISQKVEIINSEREQGFLVFARSPWLKSMGNDQNTKSCSSQSEVISQVFEKLRNVTYEECEKIQNLTKL